MNRAVVVNEKVLALDKGTEDIGKVSPYVVTWCEVLSGPTMQGGRFCVCPGSVIRPATLADFEKFRVSNPLIKVGRLKLRCYPVTE